MKIPTTIRLNGAFAASLLTVALLLHTNDATAQAANGNPPAFMTYQGFLADGNGTALATNAPKNYDVIFRIWDSASGGAKLWAEQQTVTVDKGYFSVLLGEGSSTGEPRPVLGTLFTNNTASDRWVGITVKGIGSSGADVDILPRLRLLTSPYSFLAQRAVSAASVDGAGVISGTVPDQRLSPNVALRSGGNSFSGDQSFSGDFFLDGRLNFGLNGFNLRNNANISRLFVRDDGNVGIGTTSPADKLHVAGNVRATGSFIGAMDGSNLNNNSVDVSKLVAAVKDALCPPGTIVAYAGDTAPPGWLMCDGTYGNNPASYPALFAAIGYRFGGFTSGGVHWFLTPDLRGRFLRGRDAGAGRDPDRGSRTATYPEGATGDAVGSVQGDQYRSHTHQWLGSNGNNSPSSVDFTASEFGSKNEYQNTLASGGNETRPVNMNVNYIIKY